MINRCNAALPTLHRGYVILIPRLCRGYAVFGKINELWRGWSTNTHNRHSNSLPANNNNKNSPGNRNKHTNHTQPSIKPLSMLFLSISCRFHTAVSYIENLIVWFECKQPPVKSGHIHITLRPNCSTYGKNCSARQRMPVQFTAGKHIQYQ